MHSKEWLDGIRPNMYWRNNMGAAGVCLSQTPVMQGRSKLEAVYRKRGLIRYGRE